jgi:putative transposase
MELAVMPQLRRPPPPSKPNALRDRLSPHVEESVVGLLDPVWIEAMAEDMGAVQRHRLHHSGLLVCSLILSAFERESDAEGRWLDAATIYRDLGGGESGATSFRDMGRKLLPVMQKMMGRRVKMLTDAAKTTELKGRLKAFGDVLVPDGCAFKLASVLSGISPGTGQPAEIKLHSVYSMKAATAVEITPTAGSVHDSDGFWPTWEPGALYIWDLGYQNVDRFVDGALAGAHLLQRLKDNHNPVIIASYGARGGRREIRDADGERVRLEEALATGLVHKQEVLDLGVRLSDSKGRTYVARVVCVPTAGEDRYYLTTLSRSTFTPHDVAELYRIRWEVELFFKNWKGGVRMDHVHRLRNPTSLAVAVTASMLAALLSRDLYAALERIAEQVTPMVANDNGPRDKSSIAAGFPPFAAVSA